MRTITGPQLTTLLSAHPTHWLKVEVANASGTYKDLTNLGSVDWVDGCSITCEQLDAPIATATITLRRTGVLPKGLSPLLVASPLNVNDAAAYAPLLDVGRSVRISCAVVALGATPAAGDWKELFFGRIDTVSWGSDPITISCSDLGAWLMDVQIEAEGIYGSVGGVAVETVMQQLLTAWPGGVLSVPTLYTPTSPGWLLHEYKQDRVKLLEAVRALALQIGWDCYYRYDATDTFRLTFFVVNRAKTVADATIGPTHYFEVSNLELALENIRNACKVIYRKTDDTVDSVTASDATSIAHFGRRYMEVQEAGASNIDASTEAQLLADAAVNDLKSPIAEQEIKMLLYWPLQKGDLVAFTANGTHYDQDQKLAVISVRHDFANGTGTTTIQVRGNVAGAYADWLRVFEQNLVTPQVATLLPTWTIDDYLSVSMTGNGITGSFKVAVSDTAYPDLATVRAATAVNGRTAEKIFTGPFTLGDTIYVAALAYSGKDGTGGESKVSEVTIDVLGSESIYTECKARVTAVTATTVTVTVTATAPSGTPTVGLVEITGNATRASGHGAVNAGGGEAGGGVLTWAQNGTDNVWVFNRPAVNSAGIGQVQFRSVDGTSVTDDDFVVIPEVGRDTIYLVMRARVISSVGSTHVVRVAVADPYPQGAGSVTITYTETGGSGTACSPASGGIVTPAATLTEAAGTYIDYQITRPAFNSGTRRVTFTATAANRVTDSDAADVPPNEATSAPVLVIAIGNSQSVSVATALASAVVSAPTNATSIKWMASTSSQPSRTTTAASGTSLSTGAPTFVITDLGVALSLGDTVYLTVVYYDAFSTLMDGSAQGKKTRESILATKTYFYAGRQWSLMFAREDGVAISIPYEVDDTDGALRLLAGSVPAGKQWQVFWSMNLVVPSGSTLTQLKAALYQNDTYGDMVTEVEIEKLGTGTVAYVIAANAGAVFADYTDDFSEATSGNIYAIIGFISVNQYVDITKAAIREVSVTFTSPNSGTTL